VASAALAASAAVLVTLLHPPAGGYQPVSLKEETVTPTSLDHFNQALRFTKHLGQNFLDLAKALRQLKKEEPGLFARVLAERRIEPRKAYYLVEIDRCLSELQIERRRLAQIGWTKVQIIGDYLTPANFEHYLCLAEQHTVDELKTVVKGGVPAMAPRRVTLILPPHDYGRFESVLLQYGARKHGRTLSGKEAAIMKVIDKALGVTP
jgi:hypothetical protein